MNLQELMRLKGEEAHAIESNDMARAQELRDQIDEWEKKVGMPSSQPGRFSYDIAPREKLHSRHSTRRSPARRRRAFN